MGDEQLYTPISQRRRGTLAIELIALKDCDIVPKNALFCNHTAGSALQSRQEN